ncbi:SPW repeat domain-containing protein [Agrobacterium sp. CG674]
MRFVPTKFHGFVDYLVGLVMMGLPYVLGLNGTPQMALVILGVVVIFYSLITDYELGMLRFLRVRFHLFLDGLLGIALLVFFSLFDLPFSLIWPVYVIGATALFFAATTQVQAK